MAGRLPGEDAPGGCRQSWLVLTRSHSARGARRQRAPSGARSPLQNSPIATRHATERRVTAHRLEMVRGAASCGAVQTANACVAGATMGCRTRQRPGASRSKGMTRETEARNNTRCGNRSSDQREEEPVQSVNRQSVMQRSDDSVSAVWANEAGNRRVELAGRSSEIGEIARDAWQWLSSLDRWCGSGVGGTLCEARRHRQRG